MGSLRFTISASYRKPSGGPLKDSPTTSATYVRSNIFSPSSRSSTVHAITPDLDIPLAHEAAALPLCQCLVPAVFQPAERRRGG